MTNIKTKRFDFDTRLSLEIYTRINNLYKNFKNRKDIEILYETRKDINEYRFSRYILYREL